MNIPKETVDFLEHSLNIDLRVRKFYELFENLHDIEKKYPFPAKGIAAPIGVRTNRDVLHNNETFKTIKWNLMGEVT